VQQGAPGEERKVVTVLFADVTGSTQLGERLDPERFREVMAAYFAAMRQEIEAEGGTVEKFIGDAIMAAFGVPTAHEDDPARALRAAERMLRRLDLVNEELASSHGVALQIRIGINTGEVLAAIAARPGEAMVTGDTVNAAARLQAEAEPGQIVAGARTAQAVRGFAFNDLGTLELKGKSAPVRAYVLRGEIQVLPERGVPGLQAPMVGRDAELDLLRSIYVRAERERRPNLVTVFGDAGVGKSRLVREFVWWAESRDPAPLVLRGRCLPYGDGITYWPLAEILKAQAGVLDTDPPELTREKIRKAGADLLTEAVTDDRGQTTAALAYTVGVEDPDYPFDELDPKDVRAQVHAAWRSFFTALGSSQPTVVVVEDIHWADPALLDLLEELADRVEGAVLLVCPSRPDLTAVRPSWGGGRRNTSTVALDPLAAEDADRLVRLLLTVHDLPASVHSRILERAEGNPFFLEEIIRRLIDGGHLVRSGDRWHASHGIDDVDIPDTVQAVLASRIDLLAPEDKRVLQAAAVVGRAFWTGPVEELTALPGERMEPALRRLEERELVLSRMSSTLSGEPEYLFKHVLTRDVAYESLPRRERGAAHTAVARWLERTAGDRAGEFAELLAYHYSTAVVVARDVSDESDPELRSTAVRWLLRASRDARRRLVVRKAQYLAEQGLELAGLDEERVDALETLAEACFDAYEGDLAWRYFREAAQVLGRSTGRNGERIAFLCARACEIPQRWPGSIRGTLPSEAEAKELYDLGHAALPPGDSEARIRLLGVRAGWPFGYPSPSADEDGLRPFVAAGIEAADVALRMDLPNLASGALDAATAAWSSIGYYGRVLPLWERRAAILPDVTDTLEIGDCYAMGAWVHFELGRYATALDVADAGLSEVSGRGPNVELHLRAWRVDTLYRLARWDEAIAEFALMNDLLDERRDDPPYFVTQAVAPVATIHELRGDRSESDRLGATMSRLMSGHTGRLYPFFLRYLVVRGDLEQGRSLHRSDTWRVHANDVYEAEAELIAALGAWDEVPGRLDEMRAHASMAGTAGLVAFADRLEGRAALAASDAASAATFLERSAETFASMDAPWERALSELELADALTISGLAAQATDVAARAAATFEALGDLKHLAAVRAARRP
jgi:class 3 adenylate cyclase/tetratricopeptide (TPR) repeat protein